MSDFPVLNPEEKAWIEEYAERPLSNDEAQILLRQARVAPGPYEKWLLNREGGA